MVRIPTIMRTTVKLLVMFVTVFSCAQAFAEIRFDVFAKWRYSNITKQGEFFTSINRKTCEFPQSRKPWISDRESVIFGINFPAPVKVGEMNPLINKVRLYWGELVPKPGSWGGILVTRDDRIIRLDVDKNKILYPHDRTIIRFKPVDVKTLYFAVKGKNRKNWEIRNLLNLLRTTFLNLINR